MIKGKRVLLTGAASGLGKATMRLLFESGARVIGLDKVPGDATIPGKILVADLRNPQAVKQAVAEAIQLLGGLDILINNAGVLSLQDAGAEPSKEVTDAVEVNLLGPWRVTAAALPALLESRGRVINIASLFAVVNAPLIPGYTTSKRALAAYSDVLRFQYGDRIHVTTLYPGYINTPIHMAAERQGLSVARIVSFYAGQRKLLSLEEPLLSAARGVLRACEGRPPRDRGLTFLGTLSLLAARHLPRLVDWFVGWRLRSLIRTGGLTIKLDASA